MRHWLVQNRNFLLLMLGFGFFRMAIADWKPIPSGSMRPTILEGDVVLVNRLAYDLKLPLTPVSLMRLDEPRRGDVVVFSSPQDGTRLIKRLVALPGDVVELRDDVLVINGQVVQQSSASRNPVAEAGLSGLHAKISEEALPGHAHAVQQLPGVMAMRSFGPIRVPPDHYFFLGDNRDNSADSRYIGSVPRSSLIGRAHHIVVSADITGQWLPRWSRFGQAIE